MPKSYNYTPTAGSSAQIADHCVVNGLTPISVFAHNGAKANVHLVLGKSAFKGKSNTTVRPHARAKYINRATQSITKETLRDRLRAKVTLRKMLDEQCDQLAEADDESQCDQLAEAD